MTPVVATFILMLGAWTVEFNENAQLLTLTDQAANVRLAGELGFVVNDQAWRIAAPQDAVKDRLALMDPDGNVQGYLAFNVQGERLEALVYHRTRQFYSGVLTYRGDASFRDDSFPCRTNPARGERVLTLASGAADSDSFDSLFAREEDLALRFDVAKLQLTTKRNDARDGVETKDYLDDAQYAFKASCAIEEASEAVFVVELDKNYFQKRWVPYYAPLDRKRCPKPPTGWMSWNVYFDKATAEDNLAEARVGKEFLQPFGCEIWSIESWQGNSDQLPVSNFYNLNLERNEKQFPEGMKKLADDIRALGFKPGLWTAPFGTGSKEFYESHKDWFLHDKNGAPMHTWNGVYTIDPSNDEVIEHLRHIHDVASHEWGYEFFKIDGMSGSGPGYCAHFYERPEVRAAFKNPDVEAPFERCVKALRDGIGDDRIFLACQGHFTGPEAKYADAARTGADIVHPNQPVKWANVMQQAGRTLNQIFVNNIVFYSDPDTLLVSDALSIEEARVTTTIVALPGQQTFFGDKLAQLPPERMKLLQQSLPVCDVRPGNLYPYFSNLPVWDLKVGKEFAQWDVVALFNWTDEDATIGCSLDELGLAQGDYVAYEFWTAKYFGESSTRFDADVPARGVRLPAVHKKQNVPQFLSSDRHVTQGAVDLLDSKWNDEEKTLELKLQLVANNTTNVSVLIPEGFEFAQASGDGASIESTAQDGSVLKLGVRAIESREAIVKATFKK